VLVDLTAKVSYGRFCVQRPLAWLKLFCVTKDPSTGLILMGDHFLTFPSKPSHDKEALEHHRKLIISGSTPFPLHLWLNANAFLWLLTIQMSMITAVKKTASPVGQRPSTETPDKSYVSLPFDCKLKSSSNCKNGSPSVEHS
jgi:hypothetical protein